MTPYIDMHCDTLMQAWLHRKKDVFSLPKAMVDVERLQKGVELADGMTLPAKARKVDQPEWLWERTPP
ncbi:MAG: hypothetical protein RR814_07090, partial [Oscillospiraceae bacterium]